MTRNQNQQYNFDFEIRIDVKSLSEFGWLGIRIHDDLIPDPQSPNHKRNFKIGTSPVSVNNLAVV